jgi:hypothetical protein
MAKRMRHYEMWRFFEHVLKTAEVAEQGHIAAIELSSGLIVKGATAEGLLVIGTFERSLTGDGTEKARVRLFKEIELHRFVNDAAANDVQLGDIGNVCYLKDSQTVSMLATGRSVAGRVWWVSSAGVLIEPAISMGIQGEPGA